MLCTALCSKRANTYADRIASNIPFGEHTISAGRHTHHGVHRQTQRDEITGTNERAL